MGRGGVRGRGAGSEEAPPPALGPATSDLGVHALVVRHAVLDPGHGREEAPPPGVGGRGSSPCLSCPPSLTRGHPPVPAQHQHLPQAAPRPSAHSRAAQADAAYVKAAGTRDSSEPGGRDGSGRGQGGAAGTRSPASRPTGSTSAGLGVISIAPPLEERGGLPH